VRRRQCAAGAYLTVVAARSVASRPTATLVIVLRVTAASLARLGMVPSATRPAS
jgi:hypothetical protein